MAQPSIVDAAASDCVFCQIGSGTRSANVFWETPRYLAFLSGKPNTLGASVVIPRLHRSSYGFDLSGDELCELMLASKAVARILDSKLAGVGRTGLVLEGFGVDHVHTKLYPMHGTEVDEWRPIRSEINTYFTRYEGYLSSHDSERADPLELQRLAARLRS